jgi:hypothetical protein
VGAVRTSPRFSAPQIGCPESAIEVADQGGGAWQASCNGQMYQCSMAQAYPAAAAAAAVAPGKPNLDLTAAALGEGINPSTAVACAPFGDSGASRPRPAPAVEPLRVIREIDQGHAVLRLSFAEAPFTLGFVWTDASVGSVQSSWIVPVGSTGETRERCPTKLMIDGEPAELAAAKYRAAPGREVFQLELPMDLVDKLAASKSAAARVCNDEWRLSPASRAALADLATRIRAEAAWKQAPAGSAH